MTTKTEKAVSGRPASEATLERRKTALRLARSKKGVQNTDLAEKLEISTAQSQAICRALVAQGKLEPRKDPKSGRVTYFRA